MPLQLPQASRLGRQNNCCMHETTRCCRAPRQQCCLVAEVYQERTVPRSRTDGPERRERTRPEPIATSAAPGPDLAAAGQMPATPACTDRAAAGVQSPTGAATPVAGASQTPAPASSQVSAPPVQPGLVLAPQRAATEPADGAVAGGTPPASAAPASEPAAAVGIPGKPAVSRVRTPCRSSSLPAESRVHAADIRAARSLPVTSGCSAAIRPHVPRFECSSAVVALGTLSTLLPSGKHMKATRRWVRRRACRPDVARGLEQRTHGSAA